jgi:hypothetical protein
MFSISNQGMDTGAEFLQDQVYWTWTSFPAYSDDIPPRVVSLSTRVCVEPASGEGGLFLVTFKLIFFSFLVALLFAFPAFSSGLEKAGSVSPCTDEAVSVQQVHSRGHLVPLSFY